MAKLIRVRESFGAKLLSALLGTVGLLLLVTLLVVRSETARQVEVVSERATRNAESQFEQLDELRRQLTDQLARPFTEGVRAAPLLEEAISSGDIDYFAGIAAYDLQLAQLTEGVVAFTDAWGEPLFTLAGGVRTEQVDPLDASPLATQLLDTDDFELRGFRVMDGRMYGVTARVIELGSRVVGTVAVAVPFDDADAERIGSVVGVEVCFVAGGRCVAGTPLAREELAPMLAAQAGSPEPLRFAAAGEDWSVRSAPLVPDDPEQGSRVVAVPLDAVVAPYRRIARALFVGGGGALVLSLLLGMVLSRGLTRPVRQLVAATGRVARGDYQAEVRVDSRDELGTLANAFNDMTRGLLLKEQYRSVLNKVVSRDVAEELMKGDVELGGENRQVTVLFADIRGFTSLTQGMEPQRVIALLNECMERLSRAVEEEQGVVDKYVGDELMAVFGAPLSHGDDALRAIRASLRMRDAIDELNAARRARGDGEIGLGIGLNTGEAVAGNMGSADRLNYTVLGETVNLGSRMCSAAGAGEVLATRATLDAAGGSVRASPAGSRSLKGFTGGIEAFQVEGLADPAKSGRPAAGAIVALLCGAALVAGPLPASAQGGEWPTLRGLGIGYLSPSGLLQVDLSGQLDLEGFYFTGPDAGLAHNAKSGLLGTPRLRLFGDAFLGDHLYGLLELRAHGGEAPTNATFEVKIEQAFLRTANRAGSMSLQVGRFVSPVGSYPARHLTEIDAFVRPPLPYDRRTVMSAIDAPSGAADFQARKDSLPSPKPPLGAVIPPVWGVPYMWGALVAGQLDWLGYRVGLQNGAPSFEVSWWDWLDHVFDTPSWVAGVSVTLSPELTLGASYSLGPYTDQVLGMDTDFTGGPDDWTGFNQELLTVDAAFARGPLMLRVEVFRDRWEVPNLGVNPIDYSYTAEAQIDVLAGVFVAGRFGRMDFRPMPDGAGGQADWDYDVTRYEGGLGYRLARNAGIIASAFKNVEATGGARDDDLVAVRLWWAF